MFLTFELLTIINIIASELSIILTLIMQVVEIFQKLSQNASSGDSFWKTLFMEEITQVHDLHTDDLLYFVRKRYLKFKSQNNNHNMN